MKNIKLFLITALSVAISGCSGNDEAVIQDTDFTSYSIQGIEGQKTTIDPATHYVTVRVPDTIYSGEKLTPEFTVSDGAQASINREVKTSGAEQMDFTNMQLYTVSTPDYNVSSLWHVIVTNNDYTASYGLGNWLTAGLSNNGNSSESFYMEQQHTGTYSDENCGPACAAMALKWYDPRYAGGVEGARSSAVTSEIDGGTWWYPRDVFNFLYNNGIDAYYWNFDGASEEGFINTIIDLLEQGNLCIVCLNTGNLTEQTVLNHEYHTNRYYTGGNGHFLLIKGYRIVNGTVWFEVNDPWGIDLKYKDGSYYGENRYYLGSDVATSRNWNIWTVVVPPPKSSSSKADMRLFGNRKCHRKVEGHHAMTGGGRWKEVL